MAKKYLFQDHLTEISLDEPVGLGETVVEVISSREFADLGLGSTEVQEALHTLSTVENTYLDVFPESLIGSFAIPDKDNIQNEPLCFAFYLDKQRLIFIDEHDTCEKLLNSITQQHVLKKPSAPHCLFEFMKQLLKDDLIYLAQLEDRMEDVEELILDHGAPESNRQILSFRRKLLRIDTYYQQLVDMAAIIAENENHLLTHGEVRLFVSLTNQAERLLGRSQTLKEYSLQLRELYQTQIDIQQNDTMKLFTVITMLFAPLTLIAGWFGMNFRNMPALEWAWGYPVTIVVCLVLVIVELIIFKRKKWL